MSFYRLYFARKGPLSLIAFQSFFARQPHYTVESAHARHWCRDTHAAFEFGWIHPTQASQHPSADQGDVSIYMDIPLLRAPFIMVEANREIAEMIDHFDLWILDPQHPELGGRAHVPAELTTRWRDANRAAIRQRLQEPGAEPVSLPMTTLETLYQWNWNRVELATALRAEVHVPRIEVSLFQRAPITWIGWSDSEPIAVPQVDYVVVSHEPRGLRKLIDHTIRPHLAAWAEVEPLLAEMTRDDGPPPFHLLRRRAPVGSKLHRWLKADRPDAEPVVKGIRDLSTLLATEDVDAVR